MTVVHDFYWTLQTHIISIPLSFVRKWRRNFRSLNHRQLTYNSVTQFVSMIKYHPISGSIRVSEVDTSDILIENLVIGLLGNLFLCPSLSAQVYLLSEKKVRFEPGSHGSCQTNCLMLLRQHSICIEEWSWKSRHAKITCLTWLWQLKREWHVLSLLTWIHVISRGIQLLDCQMYHHPFASFKCYSIEHDYSCPLGSKQLVYCNREWILLQK